MITNPEDTPPTDDFTFGMVYPSPNFSRLPSMRFEVNVQWEKRSASLVVTTLLEGVVLDCWSGIGRFLKQVSKQLELYLAYKIRGGNLGAVPVENKGSLHITPAYQFVIVCQRNVEQIGQVYSQVLYERAALALLLSRSLFERSSRGELMGAVEHARVLAREYAAFNFHLIEQEDGCHRFPQGLYENCYTRGLDKHH